MAPLSEQEMKKWRAVAGLNIILGSIVANVQVATLISLHELVGWISIGIWGGVFMISAGTLTIRRNPRLKSISICALLSGVALSIFYTWNLSANYSGSDCYYADDSLCDWRLAADIIFIVCGCLAWIVNLLLTMNAKAIVIVQPIVRYPVNNVYPISTTNTTYIATRTQHPAGYQQTVYHQEPVVTDPSNNTNNGVIYQTSPPGYPPVNNNQQQQQPVYYIHTSNPPAYSATTNVY
ncbi:uncharacterized protein LOC124326492 [Daphnia pulicaria]|uniref:uncharacterized protein LOC124326492 n=1 Tax=Daphnia pulicaria TaxID=35523 RepID=UPI001EEC4370|nr:uncharacterized protein LOC124326492 [Daphnia pulicaria]